MALAAHCRARYDYDTMDVQAHQLRLVVQGCARPGSSARHVACGWRSTYKLHASAKGTMHACCMLHVWPMGWGGWMIASEWV